MAAASNSIALTVKRELHLLHVYSAFIFCHDPLCQPARKYEHTKARDQHEDAHKRSVGSHV